jgi:hypothetical protein
MLPVWMGSLSPIPGLLRVSRLKRELACRVLPRSPKRTAASIRFYFGVYAVTSARARAARRIRR